MKKVAIFLLFISVMPSVQACLFTELFHLLTCNCFRQQESEEDLLRDWRHKDCYERGMTALLTPIGDFLVQQKAQYRGNNWVVSFDVDGGVLYPRSSTPKSAVLAFYKKIQAAGFGVVFLSSRSQSELEITQQELLDAGFNGWRVLALMPDALWDSLAQEPSRVVRRKNGCSWKLAQKTEIEQRHKVKIVAMLDDDCLMFDEGGAFPIWIPGYLELKKKYHRLMACYVQMFTLNLFDERFRSIFHNFLLSAESKED